MTAFPVIWTQKYNSEISQSSTFAGSFQESLMPFYCCQSLLVADREAEDMNYYRNSSKDVSHRTNCRHRIVTKEMAFYCFDILASHLYRLQEPSWPNFPNDELWVYYVFFCYFFITVSYDCVQAFLVFPLFELLWNWNWKGLLRSAQDFRLATTKDCFIMKVFS